MGTTLTGTTPQDTYDSLIKVTDNGPISGTLKALSDGLGNDSTLSLSTTAASIAGTLAVSGNATFDTNTLFVDAAANEVGIGTITPNAVLNVIGEISQADFGTSTNSIFSQRSSGSIFTITTTGTTAAQGTEINYSWANGGQGPLKFSRAGAEVMRLDPSGNVGIGTSSPASVLQVSGGGLFTSGTHSDASLVRGMKIGFDTTLDYGYLESVQVDAAAKPLRINQFGGLVGVGNITPAVQLDVAGNIRSSTGILFGSDTAAANLLDDYEEGTFTPSVAFGGGSTGITYFDQVGNYTKIGRQVFVTLYVALTNSGSSTGSATIEGLPFTNGNANRGNQAVGTIRFDNITYTGTLQIFVPNSTTQIGFQQVTEAGTDSLLTQANFNGASEMSISLSYFV